ncbi:MAG: hypothetical protein KJ922_03080 [Nanoarchaeota archaeon]|nr:hypothetical protein [Nanoarchaeota archaeon]
MKNKKGSLSLSVNAIVILILAITMLGLGLGFIKGMFGKVSQQVEEQIGQEAAPPQPSGSDPITFSREKVITKAGETQVIKVGAYNPTNRIWNSNIITASQIRHQTTNCDLLNKGWNAASGICSGTATNTTEICSKIDAPAGINQLNYCTVNMSCEFTSGGTTCSNPTPGVAPQVTCSNLRFESLQTNRKTIGIGQSAEFNVIMEMPSGSSGGATGTYLCQATVDEYSKDFTIQITK